MTVFPSSDARIAIIGLGYVGLPLALALARHFPVVGYDSNHKRLADLEVDEDRTGEVASDTLQQSTLKYVARPEECGMCNIFIVTVPTPIDSSSAPDLSAVRSASSLVGGIMAPGSIVVFESTVYPGVTEDICGVELERASGLKCGADFFLGYSPERINPGDTKHTVETITKVVAGQTADVTTLLVEIYDAIVPAGIHIAPNIRTAEAAKVIENAQRDINIAFINEVTMIFQRMGINTEDVLAAARTKWNFLEFSPGLVGGHCIGVDPFYLAHAAKQVGHEPEVILAGRRINDGMAGFVAAEIDQRLSGPSRVLVLGLTFKENVADLRNSKVADLIRDLESRGHDVDVHDPIAASGDAKAIYDIELIANLRDASGYDAVIGAVAHDAFLQLSANQLTAFLGEDGLLVDLKGIWSDVHLGSDYRRWRL
jgi:UDP-N-acetyl-D-glucosamine/UDP-N-acetyl-D-galactosamine dehydrogenase